MNQLPFPVANRPAQPVVVPEIQVTQAPTEFQQLITQAAPPAVRPARVTASSLVTDDQIDAIGAQTMGRASAMSQKILAGTKTRDTDVMGTTLNQLVATTKQCDPSKMGEPSFLGKMFGKAKTLKDHLMAEYSTVESRMNAMLVELDKLGALMQQRVKDIDVLYSETEQTYKMLGDEIEVNKQRLADLLDFIQNSSAPSDAMQAQELNKLNARAQRLEKGIDDLERGRQLALLALPELQMEQDNKRSLASSVKTIKNTTWPAYQGLFTRYILALETKKGNEVIGSVYDATDAAFKMQAQQLRANAAETAKLQQRSVVSIETLELCQQELLGAMDDVARINEEGRAARAAAKPKLESLSQELIQRSSAARNATTK